MFTPQQIDQIAFSKAKFGGYNMQQVDEFLEPLTEDYVTLYKENALLKSKMRVLVGKLEEYRKNEASMKEAVANAQKTCDKMVAEAEAKCAKMLQGASDVAIANSQSSDAQIAAENARVEQARQTAAGKITELQEQLRSCIQALDRIKGNHAPAASKEADVADEISQSIESMIGTTVDTAPKAAPKHPTNDTTTSKFASLNLQFGRNYDPKSK